jgi:hypothetical protein
VATNPIAVGSSAVGLASGDIDGDGWVDAVSVNSGGGTVSLLWNNGGVLASGGDLIPGNTPTRAVLADLDGDGDLDLAVTCTGDNSVRLYENTGARGFSERSPITGIAEAGLISRAG